jgi:hypothetical protein
MYEDDVIHHISLNLLEILTIYELDYIFYKLNDISIWTTCLSIKSDRLEKEYQ